MTIDWTVRVWDESRQSGDALVLLLALSDSAGLDGQGRKPERDALCRRTRMNPEQLDVTIRRVCAAGELIWGLGEGLGSDRFLLMLGPSWRNRVREVPWAASRRGALPEAGGIVVARAVSGEYRGLCRIARGKHPERRFEQLRREYQNSTDLLRAALIRTSDMDGALGYLSGVFRGYKIEGEGEWWYLTPEMLSWLGGLEILEQESRRSPPARERSS